MKLLGIIEEDFVNYKKSAMTLEFPHCTFKCNKGHKKPVCQNYHLRNSETLDIDSKVIINKYLKNPITEAIVMQGLEPFDSFDDLMKFIDDFRQVCQDDIVIYSGYNEDEIKFELECLKTYDNIIVKFGRYLPNSKPTFDSILEVTLQSSNQYAKIL